jgi:preprotein translocase subunit SecA
MCYASEAAYQKRPYDTQMIALLQFLYALDSGKGLAGEISTGEGKSLITSMVVACNALLGNKVMVVTSTPALAQRDAEEAAPFYKLFGLNASNNCDKEALSNTQKLKDRYKENTILYGQASDFERDRLMTENKGSDLCSSWMNEKACLFIDEVDNMLINNGAFTLFLSDDVPDFQLLTPLIKDLWGAYCVKYKEINELSDDYDKEVLFKQVKETLVLEFQDKISEGEFKLTTKLTGYAKRSLSGWIDSASTALSFSEGAEYLIEPSREQSGYANVVVMDISTGVEQKSTQWMDMLHQFIQLKHNLNMTQPTVMSVYESNMSFVERFAGNVYGVTGTLGSSVSKQLLCDLGKMNCFHLPRRIPSRLKNEKETVVFDKEQWKQAIHQSISNKSKTQPILIVVEHAGQVAELKSYFAEQGIKVTEDYQNNEKMESSNQALHHVAAGDVFIATYIAGRGTDIKFDDKRLPEQGLHVILGSLPDTERDYLQVMGRSGRNGHQGTCEHIVLDQEMTPISILKFKRDFQDACSNDAVRTIEVPKNKLLNELYTKFVETKKSIIEDAFFSILSDKNKQILQQEMSARWGFFLSKMTQIYSSDDVFEQFNSDKEESLKEKAKQKLEKIKSEILAQAANIGSQKSRFFSTNMELGHEAFERKHYKTAEDLFRLASEQETPQFQESCRL